MGMKATQTKPAKYTTFSVSVRPSTKSTLRRIANRRYGGSVSALVETVALQAERLDALAELLEAAKEPSAHAYQDFLDELAASVKPPARSSRSRRETA
jgi:hypothetical protein